MSERPNRSIDTDVLSAGFAGLLSAGHLQRYTDAKFSVALASAVEAPAPCPPIRASTVGVRVVRAVLRAGTIAGVGLARDQRP